MKILPRKQFLRDTIKWKKQSNNLDNTCTVARVIKFFYKDMLVMSFSFERRFIQIEPPGEFLSTQSLDRVVSLLLKMAFMPVFLTWPQTENLRLSSEGIRMH